MEIHPDTLLRMIAPTEEERIESQCQKAIYEARSKWEAELHAAKTLVEYIFHLRAIGMSVDELAEFIARRSDQVRAVLACDLMEEYRKRGGK